MKNYKDWIQYRSDELAFDKFGVDFYQLGGDLQRMIYDLSVRDYKEYVASRIDAKYERG